MHIELLEGRTEVETEDGLRECLRVGGRAPYGAFTLFHNEGGPSLWVHTHGDLAYLHFFRDGSGDHAGFQATGMQPPDTPDVVTFLIPGGTEGDAIYMPRDTIVSLERAYRAAAEFMRNGERPSSINWLEL